MDLSDYRDKINKIDEEMLKLFRKRMELAEEIAVYKKERGLPVLDAAREREKLSSAASMVPEELSDYARALYSVMMDVSRCHQRSIMGGGEDIARRIESAIENTPKLFPEEAVVACQGVEGSYSQIACDRLLRRADILYFKDFESIFSAIEKGLCRYGVIPLENSTAGSVNKVYDLMLRHSFSIVRSVRIKVDHNLLAKPGTSVSDIKEIYSHEQAISQCRDFLAALPGVKVIPYENTAMAAKMVAESDRRDVAAIASRSCTGIYGLECVKGDIQSSDNNYTRFIFISGDLEIFPGADRTSLMLVLPHTPGSLYRTLSRFYAGGININKLESRPLPDRNFEFMFYFDLETSVYSPRFIRLMKDISGSCEQFTYLGSYSEIV